MSQENNVVGAGQGPLRATGGTKFVRIEVELENGNKIMSDVRRRIVRLDNNDVYFDADTKYVTDMNGNTLFADDGKPVNVFDKECCNGVNEIEIMCEEGYPRIDVYSLKRDKLTNSEKVFVAADLYSKGKFNADEMEALLVHILGREEYESVKRRLLDFLIKEGIDPQGPGFKGKLEDKFNLLFRNKLGGGIALGLGGAAGAGIGALAILPTFGFPALLAAFNPFVLFGVLIAAGVLTIAGATALIVDKVLAERNKTAAFEVTANPYGKDIAIKAIEKLEYYAEMKARNQGPNQEPAGGNIVVNNQEPNQGPNQEPNQGPSVININTTIRRDRTPREEPTGGGREIEQ